MKLLVDMNLSPRWIGVLAGAGIEAAHWSTLGTTCRPEIPSSRPPACAEGIEHEIYQDALLQPIDGESEVILISKIAGG